MTEVVSSQSYQSLRASTGIIPRLRHGRILPRPLVIFSYPTGMPTASWNKHRKRKLVHTISVSGNCLYFVLYILPSLARVFACIYIYIYIYIHEMCVIFTYIRDMLWFSYICEMYVIFTYARDMCDFHIHVREIHVIFTYIYVKCVWFSHIYVKCVWFSRMYKWYARDFHVYMYIYTWNACDFHVYVECVIYILELLKNHKQKCVCMYA